MTSKSLMQSPWLPVLAGGAVIGLALGIRHVQGLFLVPITMDRGWTRETFGLAIALQNLIDFGILKWLLVNSVKDAFIWVGTDCDGFRWIALRVGVQFAARPAVDRGLLLHRDRASPAARVDSQPQRTTANQRRPLQRANAHSTAHAGATAHRRCSAACRRCSGAGVRFACGPHIRRARASEPVCSAAHTSLR